MQYYLVIDVNDIILKECLFQLHNTKLEIETTFKFFVTVILDRSVYIDRYVLALLESQLFEIKSLFRKVKFLSRDRAEGELTLTQDNIY